MGLAIDHGSVALRRHLLSRADLDTLIGFENRRAIFPIHRGVRFLLATSPNCVVPEIVFSRPGSTLPGDSGG